MWVYVDPVADRTLERLGQFDTIIVKRREGMLKLLKDVAAGATLTGMDAVSYRVRSAVFTAWNVQTLGNPAHSKVPGAAKKETVDLY